MRQAGRIAQDSRQELNRELKSDGSVVTAGDKLVEEYLRKALPRLVPHANVWGEELGFAEEGVGGLWAVDPIDGTTNYAFGSPLWGTSVALVQGSRVRAGAVFLPDLDELYFSSEDGGSTLNGQPLTAIQPGVIKPFELISYSETVIRRHPWVRWPGKMRTSGSFVVEGAFVATQRFRGMVGIKEKLYDLAAVWLINKELGAEIRYATGKEFKIADLMQDRKISEAWLIFPKGSNFKLEEAPRGSLR